MRGWRRRSVEDFEEEVRSHIAHEADRLESLGMPRSAALAEARRRFGSEREAAERFFETQRGMRSENLLRDVALAFRALRRRPAFTAAAVLTLAVGVGVNAAIFNVLYGIALRGLPLRDPDRVVAVHHEFPAFGMWRASGWMGDATIGRESYQRQVNGQLDMASYPEYLTYRETAGSLAGLASFSPIDLILDTGESQAVRGLLASCDYFAVLGVGMTLGRSFARDECERAGDTPVLVLSHSLWQRRFGSDESVVGRELRANGELFTVIGVAAAGFRGTELYARDVWLPVTMQPRFAGERLTDADRSWLHLVGRMRDGVTTARAAAELNVIADRWDRTTPGRETTVHVRAARRVSQPGARFEIGVNGVAALLLAAFVLLMVCLNIMNLLLARAPARQQVVRIQLSLGAGRRRIITQLLVESVLLALLGGIAGVALAYLVLPPVFETAAGTGLQLDLSPDVRVFAFGLVVSLIASVTFGLAPALEAVRIDLASALRGGLGDGRRRGVLLRNTIVTVQIAGSLALLMMCALLVRAVTRAQTLDPGYAVEDVIAFRPELRVQGYGAARGLAFQHEFRARVAALPGVRATALSAMLPLGSRSTGRFRHDTGAADESLGTVDNHYVSAGYLEALGITVLRGRPFRESDERASGPIAAVIGQAMAERFWPGEDPVGRIFSATSRTYEVVGIARDAHNLSLAETDRTFFYAAAQIGATADTPTGEASAWFDDHHLIVRTEPGASVTDAVLRVAREMDPSVPVAIRSFEELVAGQLESSRVMAMFAGVFGVLAMILALVGVYGAIAYGVSRRTREFGLRIAVGAERRDIVRLAVRQGVLPLIAGVSGGALLAGVGSLLARGQLFGLPPLDPIAFATMIAAVVAAAVAAMITPARRAAAIDPMRTLRHD